jgi:hypothetical protein
MITEIGEVRWVRNTKHTKLKKKQTVLDVKLRKAGRPHGKSKKTPIVTLNEMVIWFYVCPKCGRNNRVFKPKPHRIYQCGSCRKSVYAE